MKKILSLLMILLMVSFAATAAPFLSLSEGNLDGLTLYAPDGSPLDSLSDIGESGMVIRASSDAVSFTSDYGDIHLGGNSLLAVTGFDLSDASLYLVYGDLSVILHTGISLKIFTPSSYATLQSPGEYFFESTDNAERFCNFSDNPVTVYDGIRGIEEEVGSMEELNYKAWPRTIEEVSAAEYYDLSVTGDRVIYDEPVVPSSPSISEPELSLPLPEPVIIDMTEETGTAIPVTTEEEIATPSSPSLDEPVVNVNEPEPVVITITDGEKEVTEPDVVTEPEKGEEAAAETEEETPVVDKPVVITEGPVVSATEPKVEEKKDLPISGGVDAGYSYIFGSSTSIYEIKPWLTLGTEKYSIGLRAPIRLAYSGNDFYLAGFNGHEKWDFGKSETDNSMKIYRAVTDSLAILDSLTLGKEESSIAYINANRDYRKNGILFMDYGTEDALAVRMGFNFPNLSLSIYADNAEAPHIVEGALSFYPGKFGGSSLSIIVPGEILMKSTFKDYALLFYPGIDLTIRIADDYGISLYAIGEISSIYQNGTMINSNIIFDFSTASMCSYMAGLSFGADLDTVAFRIDGGIRNGSLSPSRFNTVSAQNHTIAGSLESLAEASGNNAMKGYLKAQLSLDFGAISFDADYAVDDIQNYGDNPEDYLQLSINANVSRNILLYASFAKDNFTASFKNTENYFTEDAAFAVGADFDFEHVGFSTEFKSVFNSPATEYINVPDYVSNADLQLSVKARLFF